MNHEPAPWDLLAEDPYADCRVFTVMQRRLRHQADGREGNFFVLNCPDWIQCIPLTEAGEVVLVRQFRYGTLQLSWEVPGGMMDPGESDPIPAGARELVEETGYQPESAQVLGWVYPNPAIMNNRTFFVLYQGCHPVAGQNLDEHEELQVTTAPFEEVERMVADGEITHAIALNSIDFLRRWRNGQLA